MNKTLTASYGEFLVQNSTKQLITEILDSVLSYDINNNFARIDIEKDDLNKMEEIKSSFFQALVELDIVNTGFINNKVVDTYLYYLLRNGKIDFVYYDNRYYLKNSNNEHIVNHKNFSVELLFDNEVYLNGLHKKWDGDKTYTPEEKVVTGLKLKLIEIVTLALEKNLKNQPKKLPKWITKILNVLGIKMFDPYKYRIVLNNKQTLVNDVENLEKGFHEKFKQVYEEVDKKSRGEKEVL